MDTFTSNSAGAGSASASASGTSSGSRPPIDRQLTAAQEAEIKFDQEIKLEDINMNKSKLDPSIVDHYSAILVRSILNHYKTPIQIPSEVRLKRSNFVYQGTNTQYTAFLPPLYDSQPEAYFPVIINCHGGGGVFGHQDDDAEFCAQAAIETGAIVISIGYKLGPESRPPVNIFSICDAIYYFATHVEEQQLRMDISNFIIGGFSLGANFAIVAATFLQKNFMLPDEFKLKGCYAFYAPLVQTVDHDLKMPSSAFFHPATTSSTYNTYMTKYQDKLMYTCYRKRIMYKNDGLASPRYLTNNPEYIGGLPKNLCLVTIPGEEDILDEFVGELKGHGTHTDIKRFADCPHGFTHISPEDTKNFAKYKDQKEEAFRFVYKSILSYFKQ